MPPPEVTIGDYLECLEDMKGWAGICGIQGSCTIKKGEIGKVIKVTRTTYTVQFSDSCPEEEESLFVAGAQVEERKSKFQQVFSDSEDGGEEFAKQEAPEGHDMEGPRERNEGEPEGHDMEGPRERNEGYPEGHDMEWAIKQTEQVGTQPYKLYLKAFTHFSTGNSSPFVHTKPSYQAMVDLAEDDVKKNKTRLKRGSYNKRPREEGGDESTKKSRTESALSVRSTQSTLAVPGKKPTYSTVSLLKDRVKATKKEEKLKKKELKEAEASLKKLKNDQAENKASWDDAKAKVIAIKKMKKKKSLTKVAEESLKDEEKKAEQAEREDVRCTPHIQKAQKKITKLKAELTKIKAQKNHEKNEIKKQEEQDKLDAEAERERELKARQDSEKAPSDSDSDSDSDTVCNSDCSSDSNSEDAVAKFYKKMSGGTTEKEVTQSRFIDVVLSDAEIAKHFGLQIQEGCTRQALQIEANKNPADNTILKITTIFDDINKGSSSSQNGKSFTFGDFKISKYAEGL